jgi:outer membrane lipoprotein-sorting protein
MRVSATRAAFAPLLLMYALFLSGCATDGPTSGSARESAPAARYNLTGYSAEFKQGYGDACAGRRSEERYQGGGDYQMGWNDGKALCRR